MNLRYSQRSRLEWLFNRALTHHTRIRRRFQISKWSIVSELLIPWVEPRFRLFHQIKHICCLWLSWNLFHQLYSWRWSQYILWPTMLIFKHNPWVTGISWWLNYFLSIRSLATCRLSKSRSEWFFGRKDVTWISSSKWRMNRTQWLSFLFA